MLKRAFHSSGPRSSTTALGLTIASVVLIAATYGMARFGVGLLYPQMLRDRPGLEGGLPLAGTGQFAAYCVAVVVGGWLSRTHARAVAVSAGISAGLGCVGLLLAQTPLTFAAAAFVAGTGAGLASPALVPLLDRAVPERWAPTAQAGVNSGTAIGLVVGGTLVLATTSVTVPWLLTAVVCVAAALTVGVLAPPAQSSPAHDRSDPDPGWWVPLVLPLALAGAAGVVSAYVWTYGPLVIVRQDLVGADDSGWLWVCVGVGGVLGLLTGGLVERTGPRTAFLLSAAGVTLGTVGVWVGTALPVAVISLGLFGASYMALSGTLILWGRVVQGVDSGRATALLFLALAVGQSLGAATLSP